MENHGKNIGIWENHRKNVGKWEHQGKIIGNHRKMEVYLQKTHGFGKYFKIPSGKQPHNYYGKPPSHINRKIHYFNGPFSIANYQITSGWIA